MNKRETAEYLGLSEKTVERYKASGKLSARLRRVVGGDGKTRKVLCIYFTATVNTKLEEAKTLLKE
jgi:predicted transcriptional regulator